MEPKKVAGIAMVAALAGAAGKGGVDAALEPAPFVLQYCVAPGRNGKTATETYLDETNPGSPAAKERPTTVVIEGEAAAKVLAFIAGEPKDRHEKELAKKAGK